MVPLALLLLWVAVAPSGPVAAQEGGNRAGLVVIQGDGRTITRCVAFDEPEISGLTLLERAGLTFDAQAGPMGSTICSLNGEGCPTSDCFCQCKGLPCVYWNYYHRNPDGSWAYSGLGAVTWQVRDGDVDAWMWGESTQLPPAVSFDAICGGASAQAPPPATQVPTGTSASPTAIPDVPTATTFAATATPVAANETGVTPSPAPTVTPTETLATPATRLPTTTPAATSSPTPPATVAPTATASETGTTQAQSTPTASPVPATPTPPSTPAGPPTGYIVFGGLLALGIAGFVLLRARRGG